VGTLPQELSSAADRRTSHGSKKEETLRRPVEAPEETKKHHITIRDLKFLTSSFLTDVFVVPW